MAPKPITRNTLFFGDNLKVLREHIADDSVDLVYIDPPFNSQANYNILFRDAKGIPAEAQIQAFTDTWQWTQESEHIFEHLQLRGDGLGRSIEALRAITGQSSAMSAYLVGMAVRLAELHRVLKITGSLYVHCDPTASHYLKVLLDSIFGPRCFRNEIIWRRTSAHSRADRYGSVHDVILFYTKSPDNWTWNKIYTERDDDALKTHDLMKDADGRVYRLSDLSGAGQGPARKFNGVDMAPPAGRHWQFDQATIDAMMADGSIVFSKSGKPRWKRYLDELPGFTLQDVWTDIQPLNQAAAERLGYPTQKPLALLERIISASSNPGDVILDAFAGCGTTVAAAEKLGRTWIGIDVTHLAIAAIRARLKAMFPSIQYNVRGEPEDEPSARELAESGPDGRYQFQWWALSVIDAMPLGGVVGSKTGKKGADQGIDGQIVFIDDTSGKTKRVIVQVKSGKVDRSTIGELVGTVSREKGAIGVLITLDEPTKPMITEAVTAGSYHSQGWGKSYPKIQILTVADLMKGKKVNMPPVTMTFKQAPRVKDAPDVAQHTFDVE